MTTTHLPFEQKTLEALKWIVDILDRHNIDYHISGGFAGKVFGSERGLNDIDIDISEKYFDRILPEISEYIIFGPARYKDDKWDLELITLNYKGQEIDISGADTLLISTKDRTQWIPVPTDFSKALDFTLNGIDIKIINPNDFLTYKLELDGDHQLEDIAAAGRFLIENSFKKAKVRYKEIEGTDIQLRIGKGLFFTMCAVPVLGSIFNKKRKYFVSVNLRRVDVLSQLSEDDLIGWFGHELAHIIEYETMSNFELLKFICRYIFDTKFRFSVEKRVNAFTYNHGFARELFGAWKTFLSLEGVNKKYKEYVVKNCRPDWEDVRETTTLQGMSKEFFESFR